MSEVPKLDRREEHFRVPHDDGRSLFLRYLGPTGSSRSPKVVLYIHGATFPSALSIAHRFDGCSWRDELNASGYHVWGLDFLGYGGSDRYEEMSQPAEGVPPLGRANSASRQIHRAAQFIIQKQNVQRISIIAHSWGTMAAAQFAGLHPELVNRMVFFAPIAQRSKSNPVATLPGWCLVSLQEQWDRFTEDVPSGAAPVLLKRHFEDWGPLYLDTDFESRGRFPASVKVPTGPVQEIAEAHAGRLAYSPDLVTKPVAIVRGEWDHLVTDSDALWLFQALKNSPVKRDVKISRATHLMHLEESRYALYREAQTFLDGEDCADLGLRERQEGLSGGALEDVYEG
jgi:pimeloyl-ACP methyl ester carboxylesterase